MCFQCSAELSLEKAINILLQKMQRLLSKINDIDVRVYKTLRNNFKSEYQMTLPQPCYFVERCGEPYTYLMLNKQTRS